ncbi:D-alanyl-D-alanine carboxypeptidase/D-alanyl-D-alanine endopeptidase [Mucisphaera calidilacus]|uniref:D-alanyl-D-alanine carboxypeptidase n=1 Tax=Mucisphaera calidilacus TaxID=2527982 RepID=A0A518C120_9BACT|nr:D-alanyl-D-alanine carboxypeptidase/D-alanyl-D-alanine-endopeptidase [Mucisphaera calidilacus]QDU72923.1 D-alanyl-D-alanine carboxypeptidase precursor [Mucisphaera calidilacus]
MKQSVDRFSVFGCVVVVVLLAHSGRVFAALQTQLDELVHAANLGQTRYAIHVHDLTRDLRLASVSSDALMIPASNMKLLTTAGAIDALGGDFVYFTELRSVTTGGAPVLWVVGNGDPTFGSPDVLASHGIEVDELLGTWVDAARQTGITRWSALVVDDRVFDRQFTHPDWPADQLANRWCAGVAGLSFYGNCVEVIPQPSEIRGAAPSIRLFPPADFFETTNRATTGRSDSFWVSRDMERDRLVFRGSVRNKRRTGISVSVRDPAIYLGKHLRQALAEGGLEVSAVTRPTEGYRPKEFEALHRVETSLSVVLEQANRDSNNLAAEGLIKTIGWRTTGQQGSWETGTAALRLRLRDRLGPSAATLQIADGSGLSRNNRVTARLMVSLLETMWRDESSRELFVNSLAVGGETGTLDDRMSRGFEGVTVRAKSGYLNGVSALSGYVILDEGAADESVVAFSLMFNDFKRPISNSQLKRLQDQIVAAIARDLARKQEREALASP